VIAMRRRPVPVRPIPVRPSRIAVFAALLAGPALASAAATTVAPATIAGPPTVRVGDAVRVTAHHLVPGHYRLYVTITMPFGSGGRPINCIGSVSPRVNVASGGRTFTGRVPARLSCYQGLGIGTVRTSPGTYAFLVASPVGPAAFSARKSFLRRSVRVVA
jgi:hypothetical protein